MHMCSGCVLVDKTNVMLAFPNSLTEEEEALQKKYAKLRKKVRKLYLLCQSWIHLSYHFIVFY